jgi:mannosyltransferase OCH1-like enzyme
MESRLISGIHIHRIEIATDMFSAVYEASRWLHVILRPRKTLRIVVFILLGVILIVVQVILFGYGSTRGGGQLGRFVDNAVRRILFERAVRHHEDVFLKVMGYPLPALAETGANKVGVHVLLHSWLAHTLMRTKTHLDAVQRFLQLQSRRDGSCAFPIIQPLMGDWHRPIEWGLLGAETNETSSASSTLLLPLAGALMFDDEQIAAFMMEHFAQIYDSIYQRYSPSERIQIFGMAAVYFYGGVFLSPDIRDAATLESAAPGLGSWLLETTSDCTPGFWLQSVNLESIRVLAATPKHPALLCVLHELLDDSSLGFSAAMHLMKGTRWDPTCVPRCCRLQNLSGEGRDSISSIHVPVSQHDGARFQVTISDPHNGATAKSPGPKNRCSDRLRRQRCSAGWLCNRCLRMPFAGSLHACRLVCRSCYKRSVCVALERKQVIIDVLVAESRNSAKKRIPRIIHQTWFEELSTIRYPHLERLQNSWRATGWDYRFYNDTGCRTYIAEHYPQLFVDAYDAILPGAFKADLFRLLVLFKEGGVYSDIDIQLEADLDNFVTKDLAFFVPRDVPLDYWPDSNYCLWNGLLGASPGNPIIAKALEDILTTILNRLDYYDIEGQLCARNITSEIWKLRTLPILILTGPCALGMSVNAALGQENVLSAHELGWLRTANVSVRHSPLSHFWGDALTLLADRYDLGEMRFTDVDRNLLLASTNQDRISKSPIKYASAKSPDIIPLHYSKSETDVVGEYGTYKDALSTNEQIRIKISHQYV